MCFGSSDGGAADQARQAETARQGRITAGMNDINNSFAAFTPDYYKDYTNKIVAQGTPDINQQYKDASDQTAFTFGSSNPGGSSASADAFGRLKQQQGQSLLDLTNNAASQTNALRGNVEAQRSAVVNELQASADPLSAIQQADRQASALSAPPAYSPIAGLFSNLTGQFANAQAASKAGYPGMGFQIGGGAGTTGSAPGSSGSYKQTA